MSQNAYYPASTPTLPAGGATAANQLTQITEETAIAASTASIDGKLGTLGQKTMAGSAPVVIASDQSAIAVSAGSLPLPSGAATEANQTSGAQKTQVTDSSGNAVTTRLLNDPVTSTDRGLIGQSIIHGLSSGGGGTYVDVKVNPAGKLLVTADIDQTTPGTTNAVSLAQVGATTVATGNGVVGAGVQRVAIASDNTAFSVNATLSAETTKVIGTVNVAAGQTIATTNAGTFLVQNNAATATATLSNVASSASSVTILASNASRKGAMVYNDSTQVLYLKMGATASSSSYTVLIPAAGYYELPAAQYLYTGILDGIWASANGNARVTELT